MFSHRRPAILLLCFAGLLLPGCPATEEPDGQNANINSQNAFETDTEEHDEDIQEDEEEVEDTNEELNQDLQHVQLHSLEGAVHLSWDLPEDNILTDIHITASPAELMWGEAHRIIDPTATDYVFDKLVNNIPYTFEIKAFSGSEEVGEPFILEATPYTRPFIAVGPGSIAPIDSITKQPSLGWESYVEQQASAYQWSPDGTKLFTMLPAGDDYDARCAIFDRATREEIQLQPLEEMVGLSCVPFALSWSPDSRRVVFTHINNDIPNLSRLTYSVLNIQSGELEPDWPDISDFDIDIIRLSNFTWSPDGERLAFSAQYSGSQGVRLMMINTHTKEIEPDWVIFPDGIAADGINSLQWSPDSNRLAIAYSANRYTPPFYPYMILNRETKEIETGWPEITDPPPPSPFISKPDQIRWSPDGELLVLVLRFGSTLERDSIQVINTTTRENIPGWPTDWPEIIDMDWSHNSQFLAIAAHTSPYLLLLERTSQKVDSSWTPLNQPVSRVSWSPQHDPPAAPTDIELARTDTSATLSWSPPDNPNILDYRITIEPQDQVDGPADFLVFDPAAREYTIEGLNPEIEYHISLRAIDVFGVGEAAAFSTP